MAEDVHWLLPRPRSLTCARAHAPLQCLNVVLFILMGSQAGTRRHSKVSHPRLVWDSPGLFIQSSSRAQDKEAFLEQRPGPLTPGSALEVKTAWLETVAARGPAPPTSQSRIPGHSGLWGSLLTSPPFPLTRTPAPVTAPKA